MKPSYCRLYVILAREAPRAVIFRKGPHYWVQVILWHTDTDIFEPGQWFHGQIAHRVSDLSPDGTKLIYLACKPRNRQELDPEISYSWTAVSRPPYLTALALWPWRVGGGYFEDNNILCLTYYDAPHKDHLPPESLIVNPAIYIGQETDDELQLRHAGWAKVAQKANAEPHPYHSVYKSYRTPGIWHKDKGNYRIILRIRGSNWKKVPEPQLVTYTLHHNPTGDESPIDTDTWADWDQQGRLVYVNQGRIMSGTIENRTIQARILADFNANKFEPIVSPEWARQWDSLERDH